MLFIFLYWNIFGQIVDYSVNAHADEARLARAVEHLLMLALSAADNGSQYLYLAALVVAHYLVDDLVYGLLADLPAADGAVRHADTRVKQAQVIVYLGDGSHC